MQNKITAFVILTTWEDFFECEDHQSCENVGFFNEEDARKYCEEKNQDDDSVKYIYKKISIK